MAGFDLREIEFRSDGVTDSLTSCMAPALFHENLKREISTADREGRELTIVSVVVDPEKYLSPGEYQESLIALAFALEKNLRGGDFFARLSDCGFWILLRTDEVSAQGVIDRLDLPRREELTIKLAARKLSNYGEWIERIDQLHFN